MNNINNDNQIRRITEALLFVQNQPIQIKTIAKIINTSVKNMEKIIEEIINRKKIKFLILEKVVCQSIYDFNQIIKKGLYGTECVQAAETVKKSKFSDQLKLLQQNADAVDEEALEGGELGGNKDYGDIFGDANLFKDFGGFDTKEED